jgi:hypothetical protein
MKVTRIIGAVLQQTLLRLCGGVTLIPGSILIYEETTRSHKNQFYRALLDAGEKSLFYAGERRTWYVRFASRSLFVGHYFACCCKVLNKTLPFLPLQQQAKRMPELRFCYSLPALVFCGLRFASESGKTTAHARRVPL